MSRKVHDTEGTLKDGTKLVAKPAETCKGCHFRPKEGGCRKASMSGGGGR